MTDGLITPGFSETAEFIEKTRSQGRRYLMESNAFGIDSSLSDELAMVWEECRKANWDGFQALPVAQETLRSTYRFLELLPLGFSAPSIGAEPDGHLTLEWHRATRRTLSVSVSPDGDLHYAALIGPNRVYGTEAFVDEIPDSIIALVRRIDSI